MVGVCARSLEGGQGATEKGAGNDKQVVLPLGADTTAVSVAITAEHIEVAVAGTMLAEGTLAAAVVPEDCTWAVRHPQVVLGPTPSNPGVGVCPHRSASSA
jgi:hypothetical protein